MRKTSRVFQCCETRSLPCRTRYPRERPITLAHGAASPLIRLGNRPQIAVQPIHRPSEENLP